MSDLNETAPLRVLAAHEPHPLETFNESAGSDYFIICEHAGRRIPQSLGTMGLSETDLKRHIAWDIGALSVAKKLSELLNAPLYTQRYSRLVCDCNRQPDAATFAPEISEGTEVPANRNLSASDRNMRANEIFWPFHNAVSAALDERTEAGRKTRLVTIHSFTPVFLGKSRPWEIGILFNRDETLSPAILDWFRKNTDLCVGSNQPYAVSDATDYAVPVHGEKRGIPCVEIEIRNDLIASETDAGEWADLVARGLVAAEPQL